VPPFFVTLIADVAVAVAPELSFTVTVIVKFPCDDHMCCPVHVPDPPFSEIVPVDEVPSPHEIVHVCVSAVPGSENVAVNG
jgi:hypothetical protein